MDIDNYISLNFQHKFSVHQYKLMGKGGIATPYRVKALVKKAEIEASEKTACWLTPACMAKRGFTQSVA